MKNQQIFIFLFFSLLTNIISCNSNDELLIGAVKIEDQIIPAYVKSGITYPTNVAFCSNVTPFKYNDSFQLYSAEFHKKRIIPRQYFFGVTDAPILCVNTKNEAFSASHKTTGVFQIIGIPKNYAPFLNFALNHEMVHLSLACQLQLSQYSIDHNFDLYIIQGLAAFGLSYIIKKNYFLISHHNSLFILNTEKILFNYSILCILQGISIITQERIKRLLYKKIELFCDSQGITYGSKKKQLKTIKEGIQFFNSLLQISSKTNYLNLLFGSLYPTFQERIAQLNILKNLIKTDNNNALLEYIRKQKQDLINHYFLVSFL